MKYRFSLLLSLAASTFFLVGCNGSSNVANDATGAAASKAQVIRSSQTVTASSYALLVQQLYVAYFGRPADPNGLSNFEVSLLNAGAPTDIQSLAQAYKTNAAVKSLVDSFGQSPESQKLYGSGTTDQFVQAIFVNVVGRLPASQGLSFWASSIDGGSLSKGDAALSIMSGGLANTTAQGLLDAQLINNRLAVASYFTAEVWSANATSAYSGSTAAASARTFLNTVNASASASSYDYAANNAVAALVAAAAPSDAGKYCGTVGGSFSGTINLTLVSIGSGQYSVAGDVYVDGQDIPVSGTTQPPALNVELVCSTGACGSAQGTVTASSITGSYSITNAGSGTISLAKCN